MGQIAAGRDFGNVTTDPVDTRPITVAAELGAAQINRFGGWMAAEGQKLEQKAEQVSEDAARARAARLNSDAEFALLGAQTDIAEQLRAGKLTRTEAQKEWASRVGDITAQTIEATDPTMREHSGAALRERVLRYEGRLQGAIRGAEQEGIRADIGQSLVNLAQLASTNRSGAVASASTLLNRLGPAAGYGADDIQRALAGFRVDVAKSEANTAIFEARGNPAALDAIEARIQSPEFSDLTPEARLQLRQQVDARRQHIVHEAEAKANRVQAEQNAAQAALYGTARLQVETQGRVDPELWIQLNDGHRASLLNAQKAEAKARAAEAAGRPITTNWGLYLDLREQALNDPAKFAQLDLKQYLDKIGGAQLEQLADLKSKKVGELGKAPRDAVSLQQQMTATMQALRITNKTERGKFLSYVQAEVDAATQAKGKPLGYGERQQIIDQAVLQGPDPDAWLFGTKRAFELTPEQRTRFKPVAPSDAPATEIDALNEALAQQGLQQTPANRMRLYQRAMKAQQ